MIQRIQSVYLLIVTGLLIAALDDLRKSYGLKFKDAKLKKNYNNYIKEAIKQAEESNSSSES